jgi:hypothetical protein
VSALCVNFEDMRKDDCSNCNEHRPDHPQYKLALTKKIQQLGQAMRRFTYSSEGRDDRCARACKYGAKDGEAGERLLEQQGCEGSIEDEASLQRRSVSMY